MPDDALRYGGAGPRANDVVSFRRGVTAEGELHVCVALGRPRRVRVGFCARAGSGHELTFANPAFPAERYAAGELKVVGVVEEFFERRPKRSRTTAQLFDVGPGKPLNLLHWQTNAAGMSQRVPPGWLEAMGGTEEEWRGGGWLNHIHPEDRTGVLAAWVESISTGQDYAATMRVLVHGSYRWAAAVARPVRESNGRISGWRGMLQLREEADEQKTA